MTPERYIETYFKTLNSHDYDSQLSKDLEYFDWSLENLNNTLDSIILKMTPEEREMALKQSFKKDLSNAILATIGAELFDEAVCNPHW